MTDERALKAYEMQKRGMNDVTIAKALGVTSQTIGTDLRRLTEAFNKQMSPSNAQLADQVEAAFDRVVASAKEQLLAALRGESIWPMRRTWSALLTVGASVIDKTVADAQADAEIRFVKGLKQEPSLLRELKASKDPSAAYIHEMVKMLGVKLPQGSK